MIAGVVLAAGRGERIGQEKAWLRTDRDDQSFLARASAVLADGGASLVIAVIAPGAEALARSAAPDARVVVNTAPERGQLSSLQTALADARVRECDAIAVLPVDVPLVSVATVRSLIRAWRESRAPVVRPRRRSQHGHPVIFSRALFEELMLADPSSGAKPVVRAHATEAGDVPIDDDGAFWDIDTVEDYRRAFGRLPERAILR